MNFVLLPNSRVLDPVQQFVIMIDDSHRQFSDTGFWELLIKSVNTWLPSNIRFIICSTYALTTSDSPIDFRNFPKLGRSDFLLSTEESKSFLNLDYPYGLIEQLRTDTICEVIIEECQGLIGALQISATNLSQFFLYSDDVTEAIVLQYYFSSTQLESYSRCFSSGLQTLPNHVRLLLLKCFSEKTFLLSDFSSEYDSALKTLSKAGILIHSVDNTTLQFSSNLAFKYINKLMFPRRSPSHVATNPTNLVERAVAYMSASVLRQSVVSSSDFPKEATFQHLMMEGLQLFTPSTCCICPELSKYFPMSTSKHLGHEKADGEIDFYLDGDLRWGIELLIQGRDPSEHVARFSETGKYAPLGVTDYIVVDFRGNATGKPTNIQLAEKRLTIVFKFGDFSTCTALRADGSINEISLQN